MSAHDKNEAAIRAARAKSNQAFVTRDSVAFAASLAPDFVAIVGDGSFIPSREEYLAAFESTFATGVRYERTPDTILIAATEPLAAEQGRWTGTRPDGSLANSGVYSAMWRRTKFGWKLRSELFITLQ